MDPHLSEQSDVVQDLSTGKEPCGCYFCRAVEDRIKMVKERRPVPEWEEARPWRPGDRFLYNNQILEVTEVIDE